VELWIADTGGRLCRALTALAEKHPNSAAPRTVQTAVILADVADDASCRIQYSLKLVGHGHGQASENGVVVVHARRHEGVN